MAREGIRNYAHQGGSFEGPSSTLFAIAHALANGADAIELDVHATRDRHIVVCHDETIDRTTNHEGFISDLTLGELKEMDNAYWWIPGDAVTPDRPNEDYPLRGRAPIDRTLGIVTLAEVVDAFPGVLLNLDIKRSDPDVEPYEELLADELRRLNATNHVVVASFLDHAIARFRLLAPEVATSAATGETAAFFFSLHEDQPVLPPVVAFQVPDAYEGIEVVTREFVEGAHAAGIEVHVWTINDVAQMNHLVDLGVDGIITDQPSLLARVLAERGRQWSGRRDVSPGRA